jgi:hypothetical protein
MHIRLASLLGWRHPVKFDSVHGSSSMLEVIIQGQGSKQQYTSIRFKKGKSDFL